MLRRLLYDNWIYKLYLIMREAWRHRGFLEEIGVRFSFLRLCFYTVLPLDQYPPEVLERQESRTALINKHTLEKGEKLRRLGLNEMLYPTVEEIDLYNVMVKFKPNFPIVSRVIFTLFVAFGLYLVHQNTVIFDLGIQWSWSHIEAFYEMIEK